MAFILAWFQVESIVARLPGAPASGRFPRFSLMSRRFDGAVDAAEPEVGEVLNRFHRCNLVGVIHRGSNQPGILPAPQSPDSRVVTIESPDSVGHVISVAHGEAIDRGYQGGRGADRSVSTGNTFKNGLKNLYELFDGVNTPLENRLPSRNLRPVAGNTSTHPPRRFNWNDQTTHLEHNISAIDEKVLYNDEYNPTRNRYNTKGQ